jgi:hypothetical protein
MASTMTMRDVLKAVLPEDWSNLRSVPRGEEDAPRENIVEQIVSHAMVFKNSTENTAVAVDQALAEVRVQEELHLGTVRTHDATRAELIAAQGKAHERGKGGGWRLLSIVMMLLLSMGFGGLTVPTFELLIFTDSLTGLAVPFAAAKSWSIGMFLGFILCAVSLYTAESVKLDANPDNDRKEAVLRFLPLITGLLMLVAMAIFRVAQIGITMGVLGLILAELVLVLLVELVAYLHNQRFSRAKDEYNGLLVSSDDQRRNDLERRTVALEKAQLRLQGRNAMFALRQIGEQAAFDEDKVRVLVKRVVGPVVDAELALRSR